MCRVIAVVVVVVAVVAFAGVNATAFSQLSELRKSLLYGYDKLVMPDQGSTL
jgi:hypothetical protein